MATDDKLAQASWRGHVMSVGTWRRGLFMLLFAIIFEVSKWLILLIALLQFLFRLASGDDNENLRQFGASLALYIAAITRFLTGNTDVRPFPFASWQQPVEQHPSAPPEA